MIICKEQAGPDLSIRSVRDQSHCRTCHTRKMCEWSFLGEEQIACLSRAKITETYRRNQIIYREGSTVRGLYCMMTGLALVLKTDEKGKKALIRIVKAGEVFGYRSFFGGGAHSTSCETIIGGKICIIPNNHMRGLISRHPELVLAFLNHAARDMQEVGDFYLRIVTGSVRSRLSFFLLKLAESLGSMDGGSLLIDLPLSYKEVASMIGVRPESLSRAMGKIKAEGLAEFGRGLVRVFEPDIFLAKKI